MSSFPSAAIGGAVAVAICTWVVGRAARRPAEVDGQGWRRSRPLIFPTLAIVSFAFLILPVVVWREHPVHTGGQVFILAVFVCVFGGLGLYMVYMAFGVRFRWNHDAIEANRWFRRQQVFRMSEIERVENRQYDWRIHFKDGRQLTVSKFDGGNAELHSLALRQVRATTS